MPLHTCSLCGGPKTWAWEDAFLTYGFDNGAHSETSIVVTALEANGYATEVATYADNDFIKSIVKDGVEQVSVNDWIGETAPQEILPSDLIALLDKTFPAPPPFAVTVAPLPFNIHRERSSADELMVSVGTLCTVSIKQSPEGIEIHLIPSYPSAHPVCAAYFPLSDITAPQMEAAT